MNNVCSITKNEQEIDVVGGLSASSVLVDLTISMWVGRKIDKSNTDKVIADNHAQSRGAANVTKNLFVENPKLEEISRRATAARKYVESVTLPWMGGTKLLPMTRFIDFQQTMATLRDDFYASVDDFLRDYDVQIAAMAFRLGGLFDRSEYPSATELRTKFKLVWDIMPLPTSGDFRVDAEQQLCANMREAYQDALDRRIKESMDSLWARLKTCLDHLLDRLGETDGKPNIFRDSLLENAKELVNFLKDLNIAGDPDMERARLQLHAALSGVEPGELRKNAAVRDDVRKSVEAIRSKFTF